MEQKIPIAHYWLAPAYSKYSGYKEWQSWADKLIEKNENPDYWLLAMSLANDTDELYLALKDQLYQEEVSGCRPFNNIDNSMVGFYYLMYKDARLSTEEFLLKSGRQADGGTATIDCEEFYIPLNEFKKTIDERERLEIIEPVLMRVKPFGEKAEKEWAAILSFA